MRTKRTRGDSLAKIVADLNPTLRGWFNYFKHAHPVTFKWMDGFVRRRLRAILRGSGTVHHVCSLEASEPIPMRKPLTGEPCAGEPHARFGGRGRRKPFPTPIEVRIFHSLG